MPTRARALFASYPELVAVLAAAILGLSVQRPLAWLAGHQGINALLAILVFATAIAIDPAALRRLARAWRSLLVALAVGITVLPALSWAVSRLVTAGSLRDGVMAVGLAPCEIASVATTAMAGGEAAVSAGLLIGSTVAAVALAGPILTLEAGPAGVSPGGIITNLALVVALPLAAGLAARASAGRLAATRFLATPRAEAVAGRIALVSVAVLVALIAAEVHLSAAYLAVAAALLVFLLGSALAGRALGARAARPTATALLLTTSMRDFAIAAGLATAAFGPAAAAPLGLYGIAVLVWGTAAAGVLRQRTARAKPPARDPGTHVQSELTSRCFAQQQAGPRRPPSTACTARNSCSPHLWQPSRKPRNSLTTHHSRRLPITFDHFHHLLITSDHYLVRFNAICPVKSDRKMGQAARTECGVVHGCD
jgi:predicted Na+-dependent transporter